MRMLERTVRCALVCGVFGTAAAGAMSGCGGDDSGPAGEMEGGGADQTVDTSPEGSPPEASQQEASQQDNAQPDSSLPDGSAQDGSPQGDGSPSDVQRDVAQDTQGSDRADTGGDSAEAAAMMGDASDGGACVTSAAQLAASDGGLADGGSVSPTLLFSFDSPGGLDINWGAYTNAAQSTALLGQTLTDGYPCPGALDLALTYSGFAGNSGVFYNYTNGPGPQNWTAHTKLHMWFKLVTSDYALLGGIEVKLHSSSFNLTQFSAYLPASAFAAQGANRGWIESVISLAAQIPDTGTTGFDPATVDEIEFQLQAPGPQVDGGPAAPSPTTLLVDSIWLE
jgi:hypothetical protein